MNRFDKKLTVIMPAYNEGERIYENILELEKTIAEFADQYEILVVDDGSQDKTFEQAQKAAKGKENIKVLKCDQNLGKGGALKYGTAQASNEGYIAFVDADLDLHPIQLENFYKILKQEDADLVIGSKMHPDSIMDYPASRRIISLGYYIFLRIIFNLKVRDTQTGMKLFKANKIKPVMEVILVKRFAYDIEVLTICNSKNYRIAEAPINLNYQRQFSFGRIGIKDIFGVFWDTLAVFYRLKILKYYERNMKND